ncbi:gamma-glutamyltransferase [Streptomyces bluensis]|uniref:gamma-glutamyltransferase n=1 Tax=Streptomyces bluensis TaxID=33897 RepID=UPI0019906F76|nr:gamma-glutamyltransferase [Streptomyces bluensis]GGZ83287.1 gamma-glutamyltranspeptidase [Streptomyces bluensis]
MSPGHGLVLAAPHRAALDAAGRAARRGGNAVDAALAAAAALTVVYPHQCSLGGDLIALVHTPDGTVRAVLSVGAASRDVDVEALRAADPRMPAQGPQTVTVPGVVAGWAALAEAYGTPGALPAALRDAAALAREGATVSAGLARAMGDHAERITADPGLSALLTGPDDRPLGEGDPLPQPRLAHVLDELADDPWSFYRGAVSEALAAGLRRLGSPLGAADLAAHRAESAEPLSVEPAGTRWWVAPPPSQGAVLPTLLSAAVDAAGLPGPERTRLLTDRCRDASAARDRLLGDPRGQRLDLEGLLNPAPLAGAEPPKPAFRPSGDTVAVTAVDSSGLAVSLIQSVYQTFGSGLCDPETGIVLHNRGSAFSLLPGHPGVLRPGARPPHTLCPVIGRSDALLLAAGCQGGRAQPQILAQTLPRLADPAADPVAELEHPRWVIGARDIGFEEQTLLAEPGSLTTATDAPPLGLPVVVTAGPTDLAGHTQVVRLLRDGRLDGASDPRADGGTVRHTPGTSPGGADRRTGAPGDAPEAPHHDPADHAPAPTRTTLEGHRP